MNLTTEFQPIRDWHKAKGITSGEGNPKTQIVKLGEEFGELCQSVLKQDRMLTIDAIGDMVVVLSSLADFAGVQIEDCINMAYDVIKKRTGKIENNTFKKDGE